MSRRARPASRARSVELRLRQREGADLVQRVLGGDDEERLRQWPGHAVDRDLAFLHRLEQRALRLRAGAVDLVGEQHLGEDRSGVEGELAGGPVVHRHADHVRGQQVAGELQAAERQAERDRDRMGQRRLADPRRVLDQQVAAGEQAGQALADLHFLADDHGADLLGAATDSFQH
jgi:hypothetical protein